MEPIEKSAGVDNMLAKLTGRPRAESIRAGVCVTCGATGITTASFRDPISVREYTISGTCQSCQDAVFSADEDEDLYVWWDADGNRHADSEAPDPDSEGTYYEDVRDARAELEHEDIEREDALQAREALDGDTGSFYMGRE